MKIYNLFSGGYSSNCYYVTDDKGENAVVIDPSVSPRSPLVPTGAKLCAVLLTHTHYDHMMQLNAWREGGVPVMVSSSDAIGLSDTGYNVSRMFGMPTTYAPPERVLKDGDIVSFGDETLTVVMTPGHTEGSLCFLSGNVLFSGDTLFAGGGIGRYDLPSGSYDALRQSLASLLSLAPSTVVYPGHGEITTIANERRAHMIFD